MYHSLEIIQQKIFYFHNKIFTWIHDFFEIFFTLNICSYIANDNLCSFTLLQLSTQLQQALLRLCYCIIYGYFISYMWSNLRKASFHAHNSKTHFSPSNNGCIHSLTIKPGIDAESCPGCFWCGLFLWLIGHPRVLRSPLNGSISPWQADSRLYFIT